MRIALLGGSGSLGRALASRLQHEDRVVIYSRSEDKQQAMKQTLPEGGPRGLRYVLGDICDYDRLKMAMEGSTYVIHAAALKCIDSCEYNVLESTRVNIQGTINVNRAARECSVANVVFVSSDKACNPISAYGAQKFTGERIFIGANNYSTITHYNCVRYGNVIASAKSMWHTWEQQAKCGQPITLTHPDMTRFYWTLDEAADFILNRMEQFGDRGLIYLPKMKSQKLLDIAKSYSSNIEITGLRCPEKIHEELVSSTEVPWTRDCGPYYAIYPGYHDWAKEIKMEGAAVHEGFTYTSDNYKSELMNRILYDNHRNINDDADISYG